MRDKLFSSLVGLALTGAMVYAAEPTIDYSLELKLTYTGVLYQSTDGVNWTKVEGATSPYYVPVEDARKMLFCSKDEEDQPGDSLIPGENGTIPLSGTVSLDMNWIEPGTFTMGSPKDELGKWDGETQHQVTLTCGYWMGKYEVTQAQYEAIMGTNPSRFKGADLPVETVSWYDAMNFCAKLTAIEKAAGRLPEGYEYTLPTEAQWEYACRAGTTTALNSGKDLSNAEGCPEMDEVGWYVYNSGEYDSNGVWTREGKTYPVGQKKPNAWGLYDMHGNVNEWCLDWYGDYPTTAVVDPTGPETGEYRVMRGGSLDTYARACRSAFRNRGSSYGDYVCGFRVALAAVSTIDISDFTVTLPGNVDLDMNWIEPGTFTMGSPKDELGKWDGETQHQVTLTCGYWMGKYEVTQAQYEAIMGTNPSRFKGADLPVETVSWYDAMNFCAKLTAIEKAAGRLPEGYEYTLPTEAQWEYACRAGTTTALNSGKNLSAAHECPEMDEVGWYAFNSGEYDSNGVWIREGKTYPVGQKKPNAWGLYDMHGNVWEWCLDWYGDYPTTAVVNPTEPETGEYRVMRGGSWYSWARACRSAFRDHGGSSYGDGDYVCGFRVALAPVDLNMTIPLSGTVNLDMIWIKPGTFMMGSPTDELGRDDEEIQHEVTLTQGYWLGKYEVTQAQYNAVMGTNPSYFKGADLPVEQVSWYDATNFCAKLTAIERAAGRLPEGYEYTLPTEAQWEYACRAGTTTAFNNGKNIPTASQQWSVPCPNLDEVGWYKHNSDNKTHPVGQKQPNAWGLYDMHGNVEEWCLDRLLLYPASSVTDPKDVSGTGSTRVDRGGSWYYYASDCRSACRDGNSPDFNSYDHGFRVALAPVPTKNITIPLSGTVNLDMNWIEPGTFTMGSPKDELGRASDETQHEVTLTKAYWLGKYEVTQAQYEAVMGTNPSNWKGADLPVEQVSWYDATNFCAKLTAIERAAGRLPEGYEYTLPTEAQWEYACRAGTTTAFNNGKNIPTASQQWSEPCPNLDEVGWYKHNSNDTTHPVGQKKPNAWGLYDMHGNVREWCLDWYGNYSASSVTDPTGPSTGTYRILRGDSWLSWTYSCRSACRNYDFPDLNWDSYGFRVALAPVK